MNDKDISQKELLQQLIEQQKNNSFSFDSSYHLDQLIKSLQEDTDQ